MACKSAVAASVMLDWNASTSANVTGYNVYFGTTSGSYSNKIDVGNNTRFTISNLVAGVTYYFAATAYDSNGDESAFSTEASYIAPGILKMTTSGIPGNPPTIQFPVEPGKWYELQATADLQNWTTILTTDAVANVWQPFTDPDAGSFSSRFYRLVTH